jgi:5-amino-6-(5-phospho-D-ribitylamino)uracil phosphatase
MAEVLPAWNSSMDDMKLFAAVKIVAVDLDGTLIQSSSPEVWSNIQKIVGALRRFKDPVQVIIATGRTLTGAMATIKSLYPNKPMPIILYNGSLVLRNGDFGVMAKKTINSDTLEKIIVAFQSYKVSILAYYYLDHSELLFNNNLPNEYVLGWTSLLKRPEKEFNGMRITWEPSKEHLKFEPSAILIHTIDESTVNVDNVLSTLHHLFTEVSITRSSSAYIELRPLNSDKGLALKFVADLLKIDQPNVLAVGDNDNDAEMLSWAGVGISISNASSRAIDASRFQCSHNVASGIVEVLRLIKSAKRYSGHYETDN